MLGQVEKARGQAEQVKATAEKIKAQAEQAKSTAEDLRAKAEALRDGGENTSYGLSGAAARVRKRARAEYASPSGSLRREASSFFHVAEACRRRSEQAAENYDVVTGEDGEAVKGVAEATAAALVKGDVRGALDAMSEYAEVLRVDTALDESLDKDGRLEALANGILAHFRLVDETTLTTARGLSVLAMR